MRKLIPALLVVSQLTIISALFNHAVAQALPDTLGQCIGIGDCSRCWTVQPLSASLEPLQALSSCRARLLAHSEWSYATDHEAVIYTHGSSRSVILESTMGSHHAPRDAPDVGAAGDPLGQVFHHGIEAVKREAVDAQFDEIRRAVGRATAAISNYHQQATSQLPALIHKYRSAFEGTRVDAEASSQSLRLAVSALTANAKPFFEEEAPSAERLISGALKLKEAAAHVAASLPHERLLPDGPDLVGLSSRARDEAYRAASTPVDEDILQESAKLGAAVNAGYLAPSSAVRSAQALSYAERFSESGTERAHAAARSLIDDARSYRYVSEGKMALAEASLLTDEGEIVRDQHSVNSPLPPQSLVLLTSNFVANIGAVHAGVDHATGIVQSRDADASAAGLNVLKFTSEALRAAEDAWFEGAFAEAQSLLSIGHTLLDVALSWTPGVGVARDVYEVVTGRDLLTGIALSDFERIAAAVGVVSGGLGSKILNSSDVLSKVARHNKELVDSIIKRADSLVERAKSAGLNSKWIEKSVAKRIVSRHTPLGDATDFPAHNGIFLATENIEELALDTWRFGRRRPDLDPNPDGTITSLVKEFDFGRPIGYNKDTLATTSKVRVLVFKDSRQLRNSYPVTID